MRRKVWRNTLPRLYYKGFIKRYTSFSQQAIDEYQRVWKTSIIAIILPVITLICLMNGHGFEILFGLLFFLTSISIYLIIGIHTTSIYFKNRLSSDNWKKAYDYRALSTNAQAISSSLQEIKKDTQEMQSDIHMIRMDISPFISSIFSGYHQMMPARDMLRFNAGCLVLPVVLSKMKKDKVKHLERLKNPPTFDQYIEQLYSTNID